MKKRRRSIVLTARREASGRSRSAPGLVAAREARRTRRRRDAGAGDRRRAPSSELVRPPRARSEFSAGAEWRRDGVRGSTGRCAARATWGTNSSPLQGSPGRRPREPCSRKHRTGTVRPGKRSAVMEVFHPLPLAREGEHYKNVFRRHWRNGPKVAALRVPAGRIIAAQKAELAAREAAEEAFAYNKRRASPACRKLSRATGSWRTWLRTR
jgi:hypothetical protein